MGANAISGFEEKEYEKGREINMVQTFEVEIPVPTILEPEIVRLVDELSKMYKDGMFDEHQGEIPPGAMMDNYNQVALKKVFVVLHTSATKGWLLEIIRD